MIVGSKKYACETCIKGHRSSSCKHTDRPLFEIKKKGRPITQCEHCRQLRKERQVHVKCICEAKFDLQGPTQGLERAAFPNGLPPALGTSVAFPPAHSDDSDHGVNPLHNPQCKQGMPCTCAVPRRKQPSHDSHPSTSSYILSRIQELRPLVPRPPGPLHDPNAPLPHPHPHRAAPSPYGRSTAPPPPASYPPYESYAFPSIPDWSSLESYPHSSALTAGSGGFPSLCGCGDACACPGCVHHNPRAAAASSAYASCVNPQSCGTCMDCTIMALPPSAMVPPNTALSIYDTNSSESVADWLRSMSASAALSSNSTSTNAFQQYNNYNNQQSWSSYPDNSSMHAYGGYNPDDGMLYDPMQNSKRPDYSHHRQRSDEHRNIDPRLIPSNSNPRLFLDIPSAPGSDASAASRSRSPSTSSQSSHGHPSHPSERPVPPYRPSGRVPGMFDHHPSDPRLASSSGQHSNPRHASSSSSANPNALRTAPPLNMNMRTPSSGSSRGSASASTSASRSAGGSFGSPSSAGGHNARRGSDGDNAGAGGPSLANLHIF